MKKKTLGILIFLLVIGFAAVTSTLILNGSVNILGDAESFDSDVVFINARTDADGSASIYGSGKLISFNSKKLSIVDDIAVLNFEIANKNRNYDAVAKINCNVETEEFKEYITILPNKSEYEIDAGGSVRGSLSVTLMHAVTVDNEDVTISCRIDAEALERDTLGTVYKSRILMGPGEGVEFVDNGVSFDMVYVTVGCFWNYKTKITEVVFENSLVPHDTTEDLIFDVSEKYDESVMSYLVKNGDGDTYTLYIQSDDKIIAPDDMSRFFEDFSLLENIVGFEFLDTSNVTNMSSMFKYCKGLTAIDLSFLDTSNVTDMSNMFNGCNSLTNLDLSSLETSKVTDMGYMFAGCSNLTSLDLSSLDTANVHDMNNMFAYCKGLVSLDLSSLDMNNVTVISRMFEGNERLVTLDISNIDFSNVEDCSFVFYDMPDDAIVYTKNEESKRWILDLSTVETSYIWNRPVAWNSDNIIVKF